MALSYGAAGAFASGTTSCAPSYPSGISATTSVLFALVTGRSSVADSAVSSPAGWTSIGQFEGGTGTYGVDTGTRRVAFFRKDTTTGSETGTVSFAFAAGAAASTMGAVIFRVEKGAGNTVTASFASGADTSNDTTYSATASSLAFAANDLLLIGLAQNIDTGTRTAVAVSATGVTFGTRTNQSNQNVTSGNDHRHVLDTVPVTTGTTAAPTYSYTSTTTCSGPTGFVLLHESSVDITLALSGQAITSAAGTAAPGTSYAPIGQSVSSQIGQLGVLRARGQVAEVLQGAVAAVSVTLALLGQGITADAGFVVTNSDGTVPLTGAAVTVAQQSLAGAHSVAATGSAVTAGAGTVLPGVAPAALSSQLISAASGVVSGAGDSVNVALTGGAEATFATGTMAPSIGPTGQAIAASAGTMPSARSMPLVGLETLAEQGAMSTGQGADDTFIASASGDVTPSRTVLLAGLEVIVESGDIDNVNDGQQTPTGQAISASAGSVGYSYSFQLSGQEIVSAQQSMGAPGGAALVGAEIATTAGTLFVTNDRDTALTGQEFTSAAGLAFASPLAFVTGESMTLSAQEIGPREVALSGIEIIPQQGVLRVPPEVNTEGAGRKKEKRPKFIARHRGQDIEFDTMEQLEAYVSEVRTQEKAKPKKLRKQVKVILPEDDKTDDKDDDALLWLV